MSQLANMNSGCCQAEMAEGVRQARHLQERQVELLAAELHAGPHWRAPGAAEAGGRARAAGADIGVALLGRRAAGAAALLAAVVQHILRGQGGRRHALQRRVRLCSPGHCCCLQHQQSRLAQPLIAQGRSTQPAWKFLLQRTWWITQACKQPAPLMSVALPGRCCSCQKGGMGSESVELVVLHRGTSEIEQCFLITAPPHVSLSHD